MLVFSLQPWRAYQTDGCILFSDILTPLPGMGVDFDILEGSGPKMAQKYTSETAINSIKPLDPAASFPYIGQILRNLRREVTGTGSSSSTAVLGFIGLPYTMATYMVEGGSSSEFCAIKEFGYAQPKLLHDLLGRLASNLAAYAIYQIESGAQVVQVFDSWAGNLCPEDYDTFAAPYQKQVIAAVKKTHPEVPIILYINKAGALLEKMADSGADIVSLDWTVTIPEARRRMGKEGDEGAACRVGVQGNLDPMLLFAPKEVIKERTEAILKSGGGKRHVMNLGHGIDSSTPEENAKYFVDVVKNYRIV
jgi:uroporphyrinogen decarboxylase